MKLYSIPPDTLNLREIMDLNEKSATINVNQGGEGHDTSFIKHLLKLQEEASS